MRNVSIRSASLTRRAFLAISGTLPAALMVRGPARALAAEPWSPPRAGHYPVGLELYSVRNELSRDLPATLKTVAGLGYRVVEFYSPYFKWTPVYAKDVRAQMDDLGLRCYSTHNGFESFTPGENLAHAIELNQILGTRYVVLASAPAAPEGWTGGSSLCEQLTCRGREVETARLGRGLPQSPGRVGQIGKRPAHHRGHRCQHASRNSCCSWMSAPARKPGPTRWPGSKPIRDASRSCISRIGRRASRTEEKGYRVLFGEGVTPWKDLLAAAESVGGIEYFLIEQEGSRFSEFETAKRCLDNWQAMFGKV